MFTGLIRQIGEIAAVAQQGDAMRLTVACDFLALMDGDTPAQCSGASIAVDGVCLTVVDFDNQSFTCELSAETLSRSLAKHYEVGQPVNLEPAMRASDRLGGHIVQGHVDQVAHCRHIEKQAEFTVFTFSGLVQSLFIEKGSIAINGISLTVNACEKDCVTITCIPHTLAHTTLQHLQIGDAVNVEFDYLVKIALSQTQ